ncbi:uncharacterized protein [Clytia hemisphaerica]|uniref:uncharacterized protein n=1 Tax=Clytia hemisphaerica TaxID=252671 RepID=UPI0034D4AAC8
MDYTNLKTLIEEERDEELLVLQKDVLAVIDKDITTHQHWQQKAEKSHHKVDRTARELLSDLHKCQRLPLKATADGNCLFNNSCSILLIGTEKLARDLRVAVSIELFLQREFYRCHPSLTKKIDEDLTLKIDKLNNTIVKKECHDKEGDIIVKEAILNLKNHTWSSLMSMFALVSVVKRDIVSVYPGDLSTFKPKLYNGTIYPINGKSDEFSFGEIYIFLFVFHIF